VDGGDLLLGVVEIPGERGSRGAGVCHIGLGSANGDGGIGAIVAAELSGGKGTVEPSSYLGE
jgi:hypothetical protein